MTKSRNRDLHRVHSQNSRHRLKLRRCEALPLSDLLSSLFPYKSKQQWEKQVEVAHSAACAKTFATSASELEPLSLSLDLRMFTEVVLPCVGSDLFLSNIKSLLPQHAHVLAYDKKKIEQSEAFQANLFQPRTWTPKLQTGPQARLVVLSPPWEAVETYLCALLSCMPSSTIAFHVRYVAR